MAKFPTFKLPGSDGKTWTLRELTGTPFIIYFYPKDATPGCTVQACGFRDAHVDLVKAGVSVFGVSPDDLPSHANPPQPSTPTTHPPPPWTALTSCTCSRLAAR